MKTLFILLFLAVILNQYDLSGQEITNDLLPQPGKQVSVKQDLLGDIIDNYWIYLPRNYTANKR